MDIFFDKLIQEKYDIRKIKADFAVIGGATERALLSRGIVPSILAKEFVGEALSQKLKEVAKSGDKVLIPCSSEARPYIATEMKNHGCKVDEAYIYEPKVGDIKNSTAFRDVDMVIFTSPSTVRNMIEIVGLEAIKEKKAIAIGPITYKELEKNGIEAVMSKEHSTNGIIDTP